MTKRDVLTKAIATDGIFTEEEIGILKKMVDQLDKKSSKPTKTQLENEGHKAEIADCLGDGKSRTAREIADALGLSTNKVASLLRAMDGIEKIPGAKSKDAPRYRMG
jgi:16S rRNA U516 pseudouridylate synthase RsuA-like enzyme